MSRNELPEFVVTDRRVSMTGVLLGAPRLQKRYFGRDIEWGPAAMSLVYDWRSWIPQWVPTAVVVHGHPVLADTLRLSRWVESAYHAETLSTAAPFVQQLVREHEPDLWGSGKDAR